MRLSAFLFRECSFFLLILGVTLQMKYGQREYLSSSQEKSSLLWHKQGVWRPSTHHNGIGKENSLMRTQEIDKQNDWVDEVCSERQTTQWNPHSEWQNAVYITCCKRQQQKRMLYNVRIEKQFMVHCVANALCCGSRQEKELNNQKSSNYHQVHKNSTQHSQLDLKARREWLARWSLYLEPRYLPRKLGWVLTPSARCLAVCADGCMLWKGCWVTLNWTYDGWGGYTPINTFSLQATDKRQLPHFVSYETPQFTDSHSGAWA